MSIGVRGLRSEFSRPQFARHLHQTIVVLRFKNDSKKHLFLSCHYTKNFWSEVIKWLVDHKVKIENLSDKDILFGIIGCEGEI